MPTLKAAHTCTECRTQHGLLERCPRRWCPDCADWHTRNLWGDITCPGWYCETCEEHHEYGEECPGPWCYACDDRHTADECPACTGCESPRPEFTIRNDGEPPLASDTRVTVTLPADEISPAGLREIRDYLTEEYRKAYVAACPNGGWPDERSSALREARELYRLAHSFEDALGSKWQTRQGNYTKRLSRHAYQAHELKLTPEIMSRVGVIAREHSSTATSYSIEVTRHLNGPAKDYANSSSCWWGGMTDSRCALKSNGGFALRSFNEYGVSGRAWVMPLRREKDGGFKPTLDTMTPDAFVVFNGYGDLTSYIPARIMAAMAGWTYRKISFSCDPMYINSGGYLVAPEQTIQDTGALCLAVPKHADLTETEIAHAA